ncbi:MAG: CARDB domain-containing protein [Candidatus Giovannonibacteria bacterium]|nr:CARDB domain-containing protein [Candidatus Giovannonibacteria bacterium]
MARNFYVGELLALFVLGTIFYFLPTFHAPKVEAGSEHNLSGWAWSENIGWISFNSTNQGGGANYGVTVNSGGNISGYAWSEHIGWISFNEDSDCPQSPCSPKLNQQNGEVSGWAKVLVAQGNGWDGWIHLRGSNYGVSVSACNWEGYAWGSDVVGWVHFKGTNYGVVGTGSGCGVQPDLKVSSGPLLNSGVLAGGSTVTFKGAILNQGDASAGTFSNRFQIDIDNNGSIDTTLTPNPVINNLVAGGFLDVVSGSWTNIPVGTHRIVLCADQPNPAVTESNENNNCAESVMTVSVPEFYLTSSNDINVNVTGIGTFTSDTTKITVTPIGAFTDDIALLVQSVSPALPAGTTYNFSPQTLKQNQYSSGSDFGVTVPGDTTEGDYTIIVQGQSPGLTRTVEVILHVNSISPVFREI